MKILKDTGWKYAQSAKPSRGFHDYFRAIETDVPLSLPEATELAKKFDQDKDCPAGQTRVMVSSWSTIVEIKFEVEPTWPTTAGKNVYRFVCACDSSG